MSTTPTATPTPTPVADTPPVTADLPWFLQCGRCGEPVLGSLPNSPTIAFGHECAGPFSVEMLNGPCVGPFFDPAAPAKLLDYCCICLRQCEENGKEMVGAPLDRTAMSYERNRWMDCYRHVGDKEIG